MPSAFQQSVIDEFRANAGKVGGPFAGSDLLLLTTTGARTGRPHTTPLGHVRDGERLLVVGSNLGAPHHPDWYHNLLAHPSVHVELGDQEFETIAVPAEGSRRDELFARVVAEAPGYAEYEAATDRTLPVVVLELPAPRTPAPAITSLADKLTEVHTWLRGQLAQVHTETEAHFAARAAALRGAGTPPLPASASRSGNGVWRSARPWSSTTPPRTATCSRRWRGTTPTCARSSSGSARSTGPSPPCSRHWRRYWPVSPSRSRTPSAPNWPG